MIPFTNFIFNEREDIEAILYPSPRLEGEGTNIAIHPVTVKRKLKCRRVSVLKFYIKDSVSISDTISVAEKVNDDGTFELLDVSHLGESTCLRMLNDEIAKHRNNNQ